MGHADYTKTTGNGGVMLIRVADSKGTSGVISANQVQFHIRAGLSGTWVGYPGFHWNSYINGAWGDDSNRYIGNISGTTWRHVATFTITTTQTIAFHIDYSGTQGFGGPTDFWLKINRASVPSAPTPIGADEIKHQSFRYRFSSNSNGGSAVLERQIGYGYKTSEKTWTKSSNGTSTVSKFNPGARIYVWARERNAVGWGAWSARTDVDLKRGCRVKVNGVWVRAIPYVKVNGEWVAAEPYIKKSGEWTLAAYAG